MSNTDYVENELKYSKDFFKSTNKQSEANHKTELSITVLSDLATIDQKLASLSFSNTKVSRFLSFWE